MRAMPLPPPLRRAVRHRGWLVVMLTLALALAVIVPSVAAREADENMTGATEQDAPPGATGTPDPEVTTEPEATTEPTEPADPEATTESTEEGTTTKPGEDGDGEAGEDGVLRPGAARGRAGSGKPGGGQAGRPRNATQQRRPPPRPRKKGKRR